MLEPIQVRVEVPIKIARQVNNQREASITFSVNEMHFKSDLGLEVKHEKKFCSLDFEIGNTGLVLSAVEAELDLLPAPRPGRMELEPKENLGVWITRGSFYLKGATETSGKLGPVLINGNEVIGKLTLNNIRRSDGLSAAELISLLEAGGMEIKSENDITESSNVSIWFKYRP